MAGQRMPEQGVTESRIDAAARRGSAKAFPRLTAFLLLCYVISTIDRTNIGFAALTMSQDLALTATAFGLANSIFYIGYAGFEIPSNMALAKYGARLWIPRIMVTWGIACCLTMFATGAVSLSLLRFLVGAAEAGLMPGTILFLSAWFSVRDRARANSIFLLGMPLSLLIGAPLSGALLTMDGILGLHGWQWLFLLEGLPAVIVGVVAYFFLVDRPTQARWLTAEEGQAMEAKLAEENAGQHGAHHKTFQWRDLLTPTIGLLTIPYFASVASNSTIGLWTPLVVQELLGNTDDVMRVGLVSAIAPLISLIVVPLWSWNSDRCKERVLHLLAGLGVSALGWAMMATVTDPVIRLAGLTLASVGGYSFVGIFWAMTVPLLTPASRPAAIALISTTGLFSSILSPTVIGVLRDLTQSFTAAFWYVFALNIVGMVVLPFIARRRSAGH